MNIYIKILVLLTITSMSSACTYFGMFEVPSVQGRVIDSETKLPLENVVIVAERTIKGGYHGGIAGYLPYQQALTDANGAYILPELGTVIVDDYIDIDAPNLYVFKAGYKIRHVHNRQAYVSNEGDFRRMSMNDARHEYKRISVWDGRDIEMEKYEGTEKEYLEMLLKFARFFNINNYYTGYYRDESDTSNCNWIGVDIPLWYEMLNREIKTIKPEEGISGSIHVGYENNKDCQRWDTFYKVFKK